MKTLRQIGEFGLIERMAKIFTLDSSVIRGIGDDTAVLPYTKDKYLLFTTDMLVEGVHFNRQEASFAQIGRKGLAVNISDIAAMGGVPRYAVVAAGFPRNISLRAVEEMINGINALAKEYKINIVGGDTVRSNKIVLSICLLGVAKKRDLLLRSGAKVGDLIFVSGTLGGSRELGQFNFIPRLKEVQQLIKKFKLTAMIDLSDGLAQDLKRITTESKVGAVIYEQLIPLSPGSSLSKALYEGEDFELLFTMTLNSARRFYKEGSLPISCIGKIVQRKKGLAIIDKQTRASFIRQKGFRHF